MLRIIVLLLITIPTFVWSQSDGEKCNEFLYNNTISDYNAFWIKTNNNFEAVLDIPSATPKGFNKKDWTECTKEQDGILKKQLTEYNNELEALSIKISKIIETVKDPKTNTKRINAICRRVPRLFGSDLQIEGHIASSDYKVESLGRLISFCDYIHLIRIMTKVEQDTLNEYKQYTKNIADVKVNICWSDFEVKTFERGEQQDCGKTNSGFMKMPDSFFKEKKYRNYKAEVLFIENITFFDKCINKPIDERINKKIVFNLRYVYEPPEKDESITKKNYGWKIQPYRIRKNLSNSDKKIYKELSVECESFEEFDYTPTPVLTYAIPGLGFDALSTNSLFNWNRSKGCSHNILNARPYWLLITGSVFGSYYQSYRENEWAKEYYDLHLKAVTHYESDKYYEIANNHHENHLMFFYLGTAVFAISDGIILGVNINRKRKSSGGGISYIDQARFNLSPSLQTDLLGNQYSGIKLKFNF